MIRLIHGAALAAVVLHFLHRAAGKLRAPIRRKERPEPFVEFDPRKGADAEPRNVMPGHVLGAGGRAELFRLPRH